MSDAKVIPDLPGLAELPTSVIVLAKPIQIQKIKKAIRLEPLLRSVEQIIREPTRYSDSDDYEDENVNLTNGDFKPNGHKDTHHQQKNVKADTVKHTNGFNINKQERKTDRRRLYNFTKLKKSRKWLKNILLTDSSESEDDDKMMTKEEIRHLIKVHKYKRSCQKLFYTQGEVHQHQYYGAGLLSTYDRYLDNERLILGPKKKKKEKVDKFRKGKLKIVNLEEAKVPRPHFSVSTVSQFHDSIVRRKLAGVKDIDGLRKKLWIAMSKKDIPKAYKHRSSFRSNNITNAKKLVQLCQKEMRRSAVQSQRICKETVPKARRLTREMMSYWKHFDRVEKEHRRKAEKQAIEQRKLDDEIREAKRQQRKLNFLITQTELYAHFMSRKLTGETDRHRKEILSKLEENNPMREVQVDGGVLVDVEADDYDSSEAKDLALNNAQNAFKKHEEKTAIFDADIPQRFDLANPFLLSNNEMPQPKMFNGQLKSYQLKGMNWLANLYDCGINGILADEMGLGKTVQSIAFVTHLAENQGIWGPFLIIAPASTLHNWQQECARFSPRLKALPYWGNQHDRRVLRKFWSQKQFHTEDSEFHILITSYQLVVQDVKYFQRIKWQYMILDEAQAIKSSTSVRWKILLSFNCRNRLLLTGTPIQNSMAELWALLHFIMPTLFDSHDEFNEWFSKDIESHAEKQTGVNEDQLSRLHMILKPFMLRRVKKDVENELSDKIEILVYCNMSRRQKLLYQAVKQKISIEDLLQSTSSSTSSSSIQTTTNSLMNLVMQFRKVCNHPELFERRETRSPLYMHLQAYCIPKLIYRDAHQINSDKKSTLLKKLYIFSVDYIHHSLFPGSVESCRSGCFSFTRFINLSAGELHNLMVIGLLCRWISLLLIMKEAYRIHHQLVWHSHQSPKQNTKTIPINSLLLWPSWTTSSPNRAFSIVFQDLIFTSNVSTIYVHTNHVYHYMPESAWHLKLRLGKAHRSPTRITHQAKRSSPGCPRKQTIGECTYPTITSFSNFASPGSNKRISIIYCCEPTFAPACFLQCVFHKVMAPVKDWFCSDRSAAYDSNRANSMVLTCAQYGSGEANKCTPLLNCIQELYPKLGWSHIQIPDKESMVCDSGKLHVLDKLLTKLKQQGHRVLIYSQMTRMIDLLQEYMWHRKYTYMRLDGSSKISDRRDMVADFQSRSDIFVFLLSTRAGGLGINLTAADTVIFYDSDWNPTVDQQAMDRAHRLGQTKQVTVYRLVCKGTIEEKILQRAKEKSEIQRMVISGGNFRPDQLKPKEVVSFLLDDEEIEKNYCKRKLEKLPSTKENGTKKFKGNNVNSDNFPVGNDYDDSIVNRDSAIPSPLSVVSVSSDSTRLSSTPVQQTAVEDVCSDAIFEDTDTLKAINDSPNSKRSRGRPRTKPSNTKKLPGRPGRPRKGNSGSAAAMAAALAGAAAGQAAAYAAYGFSFTGSSNIGQSTSTSCISTSQVYSADVMPSANQNTMSASPDRT
ncbi:chromatin-remodeling ATPase INO80-like [Antedon mediterranea]|uniref:chromatin-remodeling ATPase INO80-like n=1 Tax=Antedon mediterranea TaxID=105859 RepID=UPI003AF56741